MIAVYQSVLSRPRRGGFSTPIRVLIAVVAIMIVLAVVLAATQPQFFSFKGSANETLFGSIKDLGGVIP